MSKQYIVTRSFYEGNGLHEEGNAFVHEDEAYIEKCLADGNIQEVVEGGEQAPSTPVLEPEVPSEEKAAEEPAPNPLEEPAPASEVPSETPSEEGVEAEIQKDLGIESEPQSPETPIS